MPRKGRFFMGCVGVSFLLFLAGCGKNWLMSCIEKNVDVLNRLRVQLGGGDVVSRLMVILIGFGVNNLVLFVREVRA